jgi:hypothetical protein
MAHVNRDFWTPARLRQLRTLWAEGCTGSQIAWALKTTRSAVMGKLKRLDLLGVARKERLDEVRWGPERKPGEGAGAKMELPAPAEAEMGHDPDRRNVLFQELRARDCRWPIGEKPYRFCAAERAGESWYCETHLRASLSPAARARVPA